MNHAMLVLILALVNVPEPSPVPDTLVDRPGDTRAISASVGQSVGGAWSGEWADTGARALIPLEASFTMGAAKTVFGHFTFIEPGVRRTVLRQGIAAADGLRFVWPGGRWLQLRLTHSDRLEGRMIGTPTDGAIGAPVGSMSLSRLQP
jgi:hypothetical protein